jgi:hypothetical protein
MVVSGTEVLLQGLDTAALLTACVEVITVEEETVVSLYELLTAVLGLV